MARSAGNEAANLGRSSRLQVRVKNRGDAQTYGRHTIADASGRALDQAMHATPVVDHAPWEIVAGSFPDKAANLTVSISTSFSIGHPPSIQSIVTTDARTDALVLQPNEPVQL